MRDEIKFPSTPEQKAANREGFVEIGRKNNLPGIPGVDGAIDCTHIKLCHTKFDGIQEIYRNRKGYFSLNVQVLYLHLPVQSFKEIVLAVCLELVYDYSFRCRPLSEPIWSSWTSFQSGQEASMTVGYFRIRGCTCDKDAGNSMVCC